MASTAIASPTLSSPKRKRSVVVLPSRTRLRSSKSRTTQEFPLQYSARSTEHEDVRRSFQDLAIASTSEALLGQACQRQVVADSDDSRSGPATPPSSIIAAEGRSGQNTTAEKHSVPGCLQFEDGEDTEEGEDGLVTTPPSSPPVLPSMNTISPSVTQQKALRTQPWPSIASHQTSPSSTSPESGSHRIPIQDPPSPSPQASRGRQPSSPPPSPPDLFWSFSEITGYLPSSLKTDPLDDGTGINGVGFAPTRAEAARRALTRKKAVAEWKKRAQREDRARRAKEKEERVQRADARRLGGVEDSETDEPEVGSRTAKKEVTKKVRFATRHVGGVTKWSE